MKKRFFIKKYICLALVLVVMFSLTSCYKMREKKYYADTNNYITEEAVVDNIIYNEEQEYIVFWLSEIDDSYQSRDFIIEGESVSTLLRNGIFDKIKTGDKITYTSAPRFFGNGDFMPIIELSINGEEILSFEEGYKNLMKLY